MSDYNWERWNAEIQDEPKIFLGENPWTWPSAPKESFIDLLKQLNEYCHKRRLPKKYNVDVAQKAVRQVYLEGDI